MSARETTEQLPRSAAKSCDCLTMITMLTILQDNTTKVKKRNIHKVH